MSKILLTGGTGFLGQALSSRLARDGHDVSVLTRSERPPLGRISYVLQRELKNQPPHEIVITLAGENVAGVWTKDKKKKIYDSRIDGAQAISEWIDSLPEKPRVFLAGSAIGIYGDQGDTVLDESFNTANVPGFLAKVCRDWEQAASAPSWKGVRTVNLRTSNVIDPSGGYLGTMLKFLRRLPIAVLGRKDAWVPWISLQDWVDLVVFAMDREDISGPLNMCTMAPVTQLEMTRTLASRLKKRVWGNVPGWAVKAAAGEFGEAVLASERAVAAKATAAGFSFSDSELGPYMERVL